MLFDIIIKKGCVLDGTGNSSYPGEIGIKNGKIAEIKPSLDDSALKILNAPGMIVAPGFIDMHSHSDSYLVLSGEMESFIRQGITTCVNGMCGMSLAPVPPGREAEVKKKKTEEYPPFDSVEITWNSFADYLREMEKIPCYLNTIYFVGLEALLFASQPGFENRAPTHQELEDMKSYLEEAMLAGAFGLSTGLLYPPQAYAKTKEIIELVKIVAKYNGYYFSHIRNEGEHVVDAVRECIEIIEKSKCSGGQISHHKIAGNAFWGTSHETLRLIEEANSRGVSVTCDQYPYNRGMTTLSTLIPPWAHEGGREKLLERIQNPKILMQIRKDIMENRGDWENFIYINGFDRIYLAQTFTEKWKPYEAKNLTEITQITKNADALTTLINILIDENAACYMTVESMGEEDIQRIMKSRYQMFGTDAAGIPLNPAFGTVHPRFYGTFPRVLEKYVREQNVLTLEDAIRKMTSFSAHRLSVKDRGLLKKGMWADIVVFDPDAIADKATYEQSHQFPEGIHYVIVNGKLVVDQEKIYKVFPGKVIRKPN